MKKKMVKIVKSTVQYKSTFKDRNRIDTVEPNTLLGFYEDIDDNSLKNITKHDMTLVDNISNKEEKEFNKVKTKTYKIDLIKKNNELSSSLFF